MKIGGIILIILLVTAVETYLTISRKKSNADTREYMAMPKMYFFIGVIASAILAIPIVAVIATDPKFYANGVIWIFFGIIVLCFFMAVAQVNWRIYPQDNGFVHVSMFKKTTTYSYDDLQSITTSNTGDHLIYIKGKRKPLTVDKHASGFDTLIMKYRTYKDGKTQE